MIKIIDKTMNEKINVYENAIEFLMNENDDYFNLINEMKNDKLFSFEFELQYCYEMLQINHIFFKQLNEKYKNNEIKYIFRYDDNFIIYLKNDIVHLYLICDDYKILFDENNIEKYDNFESFINKYDNEIIK